MQRTEKFVREEREVLTRLLYHFREINRRRLYCDYKYGSLFKMLVGHFGYSTDEAYRRISAMKLITELPELEFKINRGELSLTHLDLAQTFFRQEKKLLSKELSDSAKLQVLEEISSQPIREAQRIILSKSSAPEELRPERTVVVSENKTEYRFTADKSLEAKINEIKGLLAHKHPDISLAELLEIACDLGIEKLKSDKTFVAHRKRSVKKSVLQLRRDTRKEGNHECSNCHSRYAVEIDHIRARALGGKDAKDNLRLLCRACNQRAAIKQLGMNRMDKYLQANSKRFSSA